MPRLYVVILSGLLAACKPQYIFPEATSQQKLAMAKRYLGLTHRDERVEDVYRRGLKLTWNGCKDDACRTRLDQAISKAVKMSAPQYETAYARLMANRLTADELQQAITFVQSPAGRAIVVAEISMDGEIAQIGHTFAKQVHDAVQIDFCSSKPADCARIAHASAIPQSNQ